ncbi:glycoside hydrolase domain-containing protein [Kribbella antibiotica]|nr:glycoside hydrolase domain-containing protein [Kribbella antibiotica]
MPLILLLGLLVPLSAPTVAVAAGPAVWIQNAADRAYYTSPQPQDAATAVSLHSARNEHEAAQVLVRSASAQSAVSLQAGPLTGPGGAQLLASQITVTRVEQHSGVRVIGGDSETLPAGSPPGVYTDALIENSPIDIPAHQTRPYWYSVHVPADQPVGVYRGQVTVKSSLGDVSVPVAVTVYDVTIPPTNRSSFKMNNWFGSAGWDYTGTEDSITYQYGVQKFDPNWWKVMENFAKNHAKHRNNVIYADFQALLIANTTIAADGTYNFGWQTFDRFVQLFIDQGALQYISTPHLLEPPPGDNTVQLPKLLEMLKNDGTGKVRRELVPVNTAESTAYLHTVFAALKAHLDQKGWSDRFYMAALDEPVNTPQLTQANWFFNIYKQHFSGSSYKTVEAHNHALFGSEHSELEGLTTSATPETGLYDFSTAQYQDLRIRGKELWLYTAIVPQDRYMNRFMSYHLDKTRLLPWLIWKIGGVGYLHWGWSYWERSQTMDGGGSNGGDHWIVRPNKPALDVYDSIRSEAQRDGLEDYELLNLLKASKPVAAAAIANSLITNTTEYTRSGADVVDRHRQLLQQLSTQRPDLRFPYADSFGAGGDQSWVHTVGNWSVSNGSYVQTDATNWNTVSALKGRAYGDVVMTFDAKIDAVNSGGGNTNWIGAVVRGMNATDVDTGYLVAVRNNGTVFLYRSGKELASAAVPGYVPNAVTRMKIVAQGNRIKVYVKDHPAPLLDVTDTAFRTGHAALVTGSVAGRFDNVVLNPEVNRADGKVVTATNSITDWGWSPYGLTDGRNGTTAASGGFSTEALPQASKQSVTVDLGAPGPVSRVDLWPRDDGANAGYGFPEDFTIQTSPDNSTWTTQVTRTGFANPGGAVQSFAFPSATARYVRVEATKHRVEGPGGNTYRMQFAELQAYGGNLAAGRPATATSSYEGDGWSERNVTDGSWMSILQHSMGWSSNTDTGIQHDEAVTVDLGARTTVNKVALTPRTDDLLGAFFPSSFVIETSPDGAAWTVRRTVTGQARPDSIEPIPYTFGVADDVRYVRVRSAGGLRPEGSEFRMQFAELEVSGP